MGSYVSYRRKRTALYRFLLVYFVALGFSSAPAGIILLMKKGFKLWLLGTFALTVYNFFISVVQGYHVSAAERLGTAIILASLVINNLITRYSVSSAIPSEGEDVDTVTVISKQSPAVAS